MPVRTSISDFTHTKPSPFPGVWLKEMNTLLFFSLIFFYHVSLVFQGVDMLDEGFHVTLYQQIFNDPESVQYTFLYWLSGIIGGTWMKIFPEAGLLGIRIAGAVVCTSTIWIAYRLLKNHIPKPTLQLSLLLLALFINNDPKDLYYNNLSALFYMVSAYFIYSGLVKEKPPFILMGGFFAGLNIFIRLPNLLGLGLGIVVFYYGYTNQQKFRQQFRNGLYFLAGSLLAILGLILLMSLLGHLTIFLNAIKQLFTISSGVKENDGLQGSYGPFNQIFQVAKQYTLSITQVTNIFSLLVFSAFLLNIAKKTQWIIRKSVQILILCLFLFLSLSLIKNGIVNLKLIELFTGLSLVATFFILVSEKSKEIKLIALLGIYIVLIHPLGSAVGIYTVVPYSMWLAFPFAIDYLWKMQEFRIDFRFLTKKNSPPVSIEINPIYTRYIKIAGLIVIVLSCVYQIIVYPYFYDRHRRTEMTASIDNRFMKGIYTSKAKATSINELLVESSKYIKPNDVVLAYDLIPMFHYWTETRPYVRNPCPWFYSTDVFKDELKLATAKYENLPVVVMQTIRTIGDGSSWPEKKLPEDYSKLERNLGRNKILQEFLDKNNYSIVWENSVFRILIPEKK